MSRAHALLSPSSAERWIACPPSARFSEPLERKSSDAADEGTLAHSLGELILSHRLQRITNKEYRASLAEIKKSEYYCKAMFEHADNYAVFVLERFAEAITRSSDARLFIEERLDLTRYIKGSFGTGDAAAIADEVAEVIDLKYGKGKRVNAENNDQLKIYALGWLDKFGWLYDIKVIRITIYQPRMDNISSWEISVDDLYKWAAEIVTPVSEMAYAGEGEFKAGSHCDFCSGKAICKARAAYNLDQAGIDFADAMEEPDNETVLKWMHHPNRMTPAEMVRIYTLSEGIKSNLTSIEKYMLDEALKGTKWPGLELVHGKSRRVLTDKEAVEKALIKAGYDRHDIFKPQDLISMTDIEKLTGKREFDVLVAPFTVKQPGAPTLEVVGSGRPQYNSVTDDFAGLEEL